MPATQGQTCCGIRMVVAIPSIRHITVFETQPTSLRSQCQERTGTPRSAAASNDRFVTAPRSPSPVRETRTTDISACAAAPFSSALGLHLFHDLLHAPWAALQQPSDAVSELRAVGVLLLAAQSGLAAALAPDPCAAGPQPQHLRPQGIAAALSRRPQRGTSAARQSSPGAPPPLGRAAHTAD